MGCEQAPHSLCEQAPNGKAEVSEVLAHNPFYFIRSAKQNY